jgi:hypothetical protein
MGRGTDRQGQEVQGWAVQAKGRGRAARVPYFLPCSAALRCAAVACPKLCCPLRCLPAPPPSPPVPPPPHPPLVLCSPQDTRTPLHFAAHRGHSAVASVLLAAGAAVDPQDTVSARAAAEGGGLEGLSWVPWVAEQGRNHRAWSGTAAQGQSSTGLGRAEQNSTAQRRAGKSSPGAKQRR